MKFQEIILALQKFWSEQGCILAEPYDVEKGAGCIIAITLLVNAVIRRSPLLALLLTGTVPVKRSKRESGAVE